MRSDCQQPADCAILTSFTRLLLSFVLPHHISALTRVAPFHLNRGAAVARLGTAWPRPSRPGRAAPDVQGGAGRCARALHERQLAARQQCVV